MIFVRNFKIHFEFNICPISFSLKGILDWVDEWCFISESIFEDKLLLLFLFELFLLDKEPLCNFFECCSFLNRHNKVEESLFDILDWSIHFVFPVEPDAKKSVNNTDGVSKRFNNIPTQPINSKNHVTKREKMDGSD